VPAPSGKCLEHRWSPLPRFGWAAALLGVACLQVDEPRLLELTPARIEQGTSVEAVLIGRNLHPAMRVRLDSARAPDLHDEWSISIGQTALTPESVHWQSAERITLTLPRELALGVHGLALTTPAGAHLSLDAALRVDPKGTTAPDASSPNPAAGGGDSGANTPNTPDGSINEILEAGAPSVRPDASTPQPSPPCDPALFSAPEAITISGLSGATFAPRPSYNGVRLFVSSWTSNGSRESVYVTNQDPSATTFTGTLSSTINSAANDDGSPFLSTDGLTFYFYSTRTGGLGGRDIWVATRSNIDAVLDPPTLLPNVNSTASDHLPMTSFDELTLYFSSTRAGGAGDEDLWQATRAARGEPFVTPTPLSLNTSARESGPYLSVDGKSLFFASNRGNVTTTNDLWVALRNSPNEAFGTPEPITQVNSTGHESDPAITPDGNTLYFTSQRSGTWVIWRSTRVCP
jgi:hypothetical protein